MTSNTVELSNRQTGRTTEQIKQAPYGSFFVCSHSRSKPYIKDLCRYYGRTDLVLITPSEIEYKVLGSNKNVIVDHDVSLTSFQVDMIAWNNFRYRNSP